MCLLVASTQHPDYSLIVLNNRDEFWNRPTAPAHWWPGEDIYAPQDLAREERGTWIGVSHSGKIAVLLNFHEEEKWIGPVSRGILPKLYLESNLSPQEWKKEFYEKRHSEYAQCGGFTLMIGSIDPASRTTEIEFVSNRESRFEDLGPHATIAVSNGAVDDPTWVKTQNAQRLLAPLFDESSEERLVADAVKLLSTTTLPPPSERKELRQHIFIPRISLHDTEYGTRTQTVIAIDKQGHVHYTSVDVESGVQNTESFTIKA